MIESSDDPVLYVGSVLGGTAGHTKAWAQAISTVRRRVEAAAPGHESPLRVDVVFHVSGEVVTTNFTGVRTGRYSASERLLSVQVAVPDRTSDDPEGEIKALLAQAIDTAESYARKKNLSEKLPELRQLISEL